MKYLIVVPDGAGDNKMAELNGKTPLQVANLEYIDSLAAKGEVGMVATVPDGIAPGSDAANLAVMGYDPRKYLTGRSPLEAVSMGVNLEDDDTAFRVNLVTLEGDGPFKDRVMVDHSSGDISTEDGVELLKTIANEFASPIRSFYGGTGYRHCMVAKNFEGKPECTPPHDILGKKIGDYLPLGNGGEELLKIMEGSVELLKDHPINLLRESQGLRPATAAWIWGQGTRPNLPSFNERYGIGGSVISAVDLIKGIATYAKLNVINVEGATGNIHTNYEGKAQAAIDAFKSGYDFVYIHVEAPDECSHQGDLQGKIKSLENIDQRIVKPVVEALKNSGEDFSVLIVPDHKTPIELRTHTSQPVPYVIYRNFDEHEEDKSRQFNEYSGLDGGFFEDGESMADYFFGKAQQ